MSHVESDTTRERIAEAAGEIFAERGFDATTVRDICQRAGANIAAVNYYFRDKQRLYIEAVCLAHRAHLDKFPLPAWADDTPPQTRLADFIFTFIRRIRGGQEGGWHAKLVMREMANPTAACAELVQSSIRPQFEILLQIVRELMPAQTTPEELRLTAFSVVGQCLFYHFADPVTRNLLSPSDYAALSIERLAEHIAKFSLAAIEQQAFAAPARRKPHTGAVK
jgi:TetR/AcrR family transcriptional regulator, regulator of cefoperazone and chloramphenicol sensitivity